MATIISDENIRLFKEANQQILTTLTKWDTPCDSVRDFLTGEVGSVFNEHYGIGRSAHEKITALVDILQNDMEEEIKKLIQSTDTYLDNHSSANQTTF